MTKYCVIYVRNGKEHQSAWFLSLARCQRAFEILNIKHGYPAMIYMD